MNQAKTHALRKAQTTTAAAGNAAIGTATAVVAGTRAATVDQTNVRTTNAETSTRERILDATEALVRARGVDRVSLVQVARAAGVSRQTVYLLFGNRLRLLVAHWSRRFAQEPKVRAMYAALELPALEAFEGFFRNWIRAAIRLERPMRPIWAQDDRDPQRLRVLREGDERFRNAYRVVFQKLNDAGLLRPIWTVEDAVDAAWQSSMYLLTIGHMRNMRDWSPKQIEERALKVLSATFLKEGT